MTLNIKNMAKPNKMATMPVHSLLLDMAGPMMISMLGQALYNVVDSYFVSHMPDTAVITAVGDKAVNALTLAFPIQMLMIAACVGTGVGINAGLARSFGKGDREKASYTAGNAIFVSCCYYIACLLFGLWGTKAFILTQTNNPIIGNMAVDYLRIVTIWSMGTILYMCLEKIIMATGNTVITMTAQLAGAITNIILDPIMIYGLYGCPILGIKGAAIATVMGQFVSLIIILHFYFTRTLPFDKAWHCLEPRADILKNIYVVGAPAILMQILAPCMTYGMNLILGSISTSAVTAYGIYYKLQNFIFMPAYGLNNASIPVISYNYGAKEIRRVRDSIKYALIMVTVIMVAGFVILQLLTMRILGLFSLAAASISLCVLAVRITTWSFLFAGFNIILQGVCQALGNGFYSLVISLLRMIVIVLPLAWIFSLLPQASTVVWFSLALAEAIACVVAIYFTRRLFKMVKGDYVK
ncbi:MAG: MATE family efflux transporter [Acidaminococcaceae bacterium]|jgi:multidrug efflux pump|nr:MATE family efflux transporter [Acidaminococcaceae bacterium]